VCGFGVAPAAKGTKFGVPEAAFIRFVTLLTSNLPCQSQPCAMTSISAAGGAPATHFARASPQHETQNII
jgi:hypothetical protein